MIIKPSAKGMKVVVEIREDLHLLATPITRKGTKMAKVVKMRNLDSFGISNQKIENIPSKSGDPCPISREVIKFRKSKLAEKEDQAN